MLGGFSRVSKANEPGAYTNWSVEEHGSHGKDLEQFGQLLATLLGHCHGSSEYTQVCPHSYNQESYYGSRYYSLQRLLRSYPILC